MSEKEGSDGSMLIFCIPIDKPDTEGMCKEGKNGCELCLDKDNCKVCYENHEKIGIAPKGSTI